MQDELEIVSDSSDEDLIDKMHNAFDINDEFKERILKKI